MRIDAATVALGAERTMERTRAMTTTTTLEYGQRGGPELAAVEERSRTTFLRALQTAKAGAVSRLEGGVADGETVADGGTADVEMTRWSDMQASTERAESQRRVFKLFLALQQLIAERLFQLLGAHPGGRGGADDACDGAPDGGAGDATGDAGLADELAGVADAAAGEAQADSDGAGASGAAAGSDLLLTLRRIHVETSVTETVRERTAFASRGEVRTADGRCFDFTVDLELERETARQAELSLMVDPLVIQYDGAAPALSAEYFRFDLDADGTEEQIPALTSGGYLALDRDESGAIEDGSELFGATDGDGFGALAAYDSDANGWIDEADPVFDDLAVWTRDDAGAPVLRSLRDCNVGAIHLRHVAGHFALTEGAETLGLVREHGIALTEDGQALTVQQLDLSVHPV